MTCMYCQLAIYWVPQHNGPDVLVHERTGFHHCNPRWEEGISGTVATPKEVAK
jgi:hypothetical protein